MKGKIFVFREFDKFFLNELKPGRDVFKNNVAIIFDENYVLPPKFEKKVEKEFIF